MIALVLILAGIGICLLVANEANRIHRDDRWLDEEGRRWPPGGPSRKGQPVDPGFGRDPGGVLPATGVDPTAGLIVGAAVLAAGLTAWLAARPSLPHWKRAREGGQP